MGVYEDMPLAGLMIFLKFCFPLSLLLFFNVIIKKAAALAQQALPFNDFCCHHPEVP